MELRAGYKQTDVGIIPEDWDVAKIGDIAVVSSGGTPSRKVSAYWDGRIPWITTSQVDFGTIDEADEFITDIGLRNSAAKLYSPGTILLAMYGQGKTRGKVAKLGITAATNQACASIVFQKDVDSEYAFYFLASQYEELRKLSNTGNQENLSGSLIKLVPFLLPPTNEQRAIAAALSDADALIASLDALIAKKRDLKQAAMQQLLTGKMRLPGHKGEWEVKRLGEIGEISGSGVDKKIREGQEPVRLVNYMDVYRRTLIRSSDLDHWVTAAPNQIRRCSVQAGDVFFTPSSETRDDIANSAVAVENIPDATYSYHVVRLRILEPWDLKFRAYAFQTKSFFDQASMICDGGGTRYVISLGKFRSMLIKVPEAKEQAAIAEVLSDIDSELGEFEARRAKTCSLKQGMMQELLTGRIRFV